MSDWKLPWSAACRCGQVRFRIPETSAFVPLVQEFAERGPRP